MWQRVSVFLSPGWEFTLLFILAGGASEPR
jgi:hypothetical protein